MAKFKVTAKSVGYFTVEVEAEDLDDAWAIAEGVDAGDFTEVESDGYWEIKSVGSIN